MVYAAHSRVGFMFRGVSQRKIDSLGYCFCLFVFVLLLLLVCFVSLVLRGGRHDSKWKGVRKDLKVKRGE